jgi:hypothetical protein
VHDRLPDVHELGGALPNHVHADQPARPARDNQLEEPLGVAGDLAPRVVRVLPAPDHVVGPDVLAALLGLADRAHFRNGVDAVGKELAHGLLVFEAERMADRHAPLFHRSRRERWKPDRIARREDVGRGRLEQVVHVEIAALVRKHADRLEVQLLDATFAPRCIEEVLVHDVAAVLEMRHDVIADPPHALPARAQAQLDAHAAHGGDEFLHHLAVEEREQRVARIHERHLHAERGERAGVLAADHAAAQDRERRGQRLDGKDLVAVVDMRVGEFDARGDARAASPSRSGSCRRSRGDVIPHA